MLKGLVVAALLVFGLNGPSSTHAAGLKAPTTPPTTQPTVSLVEYYHSGLDHYFMTASASEIATLDSGMTPGWRRTGHEALVFSPSSSGSDRSPVCRFYGLPQAGLNSHFYSGSAEECAAVAQTFSSTWALEAFNVFQVTLPDATTGACPVDRVAVYRLFNNRADVNHRYTSDLAVRTAMLAQGYVSEGYGPAGVAFCAATDTPAPTPTLPTTMLVTAATADTYNFSSSATPSPNAAIVSYAWDFGDGGKDVGPTVSHRYAVTGTFPVVLTVTDSKGAVGKASKAVSATVPGTGAQPPKPPPPTTTPPPSTTTPPPPPTATYSQLAQVASLKPGQWATLAGQDIDSVLDARGSSKMILGYAENIVWDPSTRQLLFVGSDHGWKPKFVTYRESENRWVKEPDAPWFASWPDSLQGHSPAADHGYRQAIEPGVAFYRRQYGNTSRTVWRYDLKAKSWAPLAPYPSQIINYVDCCPGMTYFPERKSLVMVSSGAPNNVFEYDITSGQWRGLAGPLEVASRHHSTEYNPVHKVVLIAGGVGRPKKMYKLDASGTVTPLKDAPINLGVNAAVIVADPVSGEYLIASGASFYSYDIVRDQWFVLPRTPVLPTAFGGTAFGAVGTPISTHGVVAYVACGTQLMPCKIYLYRHLAGSGTPLPPTAPVIVHPAPQPASLPNTPQSFAERCAEPGVVKCVGFDDAASVAPFIDVAYDNVKRGRVDTTTKASGGGSLRFEIPSNTKANSSGSFQQNFSDDLSVQFGEGEEFYVQWRQRFSPEMMLDMSGGGWKTIVIGEGDRPGKKVFSCTQLEVVMNNGSFKRNFPHLYHSCGAKDGTYEGIYDRVPPPPPSTTGGDWKLQNAIPGCLWSNPSVPPCVGFKTSQWMTFQVRIKIGNFYQNDRNYFKNSGVEMWIAEEGRPSRLVVSKLDYDLANTNPAALYGKLWLLPYNTGKDPTFAHATAYTWYDELIISRQPIADPAP